jgi:CheY-like chemotaxis protein
MPYLPEDLDFSIRAETSSIIGLTDLLLQTALTAEQREYLQEIKNSSNAILSGIGSGQSEAAAEAESKTLPTKALAPRILSSSATKPLRILVAEDSRVSGTIVTKMLQTLGHQVDIAENGQVAIAALQAKEYHLVLMDCQMPILGGLEATRIIRSQKSGARDPNIPIIALTARTTAQHRQDCLSAGMNAYLSKPLNIHTLEAIIIRFFSN